MIYEPDEDSWLLEKYVKVYAKGRVLDMGTGSGIQAEAALTKTKDILAVDISKECVQFVAKKGIRTVCSDLFKKVKGKFDLIIFNPPYLPEDPKEDKESKRITTGGKEGFEILSRFLNDARKHLNKGGKILIVCSSLTGNVEKSFKSCKYHAHLLEEKSLFFEKLKVFMKTKK